MLEVIEVKSKVKRNKAINPLDWDAKFTLL